MSGPQPRIIQVVTTSSFSELYGGQAPVKQRRAGAVPPLADPLRASDAAAESRGF